MSKTKPFFVEDTNLSRAWARAFIELYSPGVEQLSPLTVTVAGLDGRPPEEDANIRALIDDALQQHGHASCHTVANTIFPLSMWIPGQGREQLFSRYRAICPALRRAEKQNQYGLYFERMVAHGTPPVNQIERVLTAYESGVRRKTAFQVGVFMPSADLTRQRRRGFPCLQQVAFTPLGNGTLGITGFFASQYLFQRAYGNYLGLCRLGQFMAHEMQLEFTQMTCMVSFCPQETSRRDLAGLIAQLEDLIGRSANMPASNGRP